jgi:hypothetical protein
MQCFRRSSDISRKIWEKHPKNKIPDTDIFNHVSHLVYHSSKNDIKNRGLVCHISYQPPPELPSLSLGSLSLNIPPSSLHGAMPSRSSSFIASRHSSRGVRPILLDLTQSLHDPLPDTKIRNSPHFQDPSHSWTRNHHLGGSRGDCTRHGSLAQVSKSRICTIL